MAREQENWRSIGTSLQWMMTHDNNNDDDNEDVPS